jgi:hypothetical protein
VIETRRGLFLFVTQLFADVGYQEPHFRQALPKIMPQLSVEIVKRSDTATPRISRTLSASTSH